MKGYGYTSRRRVINYSQDRSALPVLIKAFALRVVKFITEPKNIEVGSYKGLLADHQRSDYRLGRKWAGYWGVPPGGLEASVGIYNTTVV